MEMEILEVKEEEYSVTKCCCDISAS